jgi:hypothetical protein
MALPHVSIWSNLHIRPAAGSTWELSEPLSFTINEAGWNVPAGFILDPAKIPRHARRLFRRPGTQADIVVMYAALLTLDYGYTKREARKVWHSALRRSAGISRVDAFVMGWSARILG